MAIAVSPTQPILAIATDTGTYLTVLTISGERLYGFRRGHTSATVSSLTFDEKGEFLTCGSSSDTVSDYTYIQDEAWELVLGMGNTRLLKRAIVRKFSISP